MRKYLTEFIGTFFLVLTVGLTASSGTPFAPVAIGAALMVMVYMGGHVSGAHYNPAVSLAATIAGALPVANLVAYVVAQVAGAAASAVVVHAITVRTFAPVPASYATWQSALLVEFLFTFALALVVLNVAVAKKAQGNSYFGAAIGMTVMVGAFAGGGISGGAFNPAVGIGPTVVHACCGDGTMASLWLYLAGPFAGGACAACVFRFQESA